MIGRSPTLRRQALQENGIAPKRMAELAWLEERIQWLSLAEAQTVYDRASRWMSAESCSLDKQASLKIATITIGDIATCRAWLADRLSGSDDLLIVFGACEVCAIKTSVFLDHWQDLFCPSRDDVLITNKSGSWVLFYSHEDQFQFARTERA